MIGHKSGAVSINSTSHQWWKKLTSSH
jgi:hypothetical protein